MFGLKCLFIGSKSFSTNIAKNAPRIIVEARKKNLRQSPWKMNFLVKLIRGTWLPDALAQLKFSPKHRADDVAKIVERASSLAKIYHGAMPEDLFIREVMVNKGMSVRRPRIMGRGRLGVGCKRSSHVTIKVEKIDFDREINDAPNETILKKWQKLRTIVNRIKSNTQQNTNPVENTKVSA